jgi:PAS domain S-box-containing protein
MNIYTPLSFFAFLLSVYMGIYVLRLQSHSASNRAFLGIAVTTAIWNFANMFLFADLDKSDVLFWYKVTAFGWSILPAFVLHFFLLLSQKETWFKKIWIWMGIYLPAVIFTIRAMFGGFLASDFYVGPGNVIHVVPNSSSPWYYIYTGYLCVCIISGVLIFADYGRKSKSRKVKSQSRIFLIAVLVLFILILFTDLVLPIMNIKVIPSIGGIIMIFWMLTIWYVIVKYKLMAFTIESAANKLISEMNELLFFVDTDGKIILVNNFTENSLKVNSKYLINRNFHELVEECEKVKLLLWEIEQNNHVADVTLHMKHSDGNLLPVSLSFSGIKDKVGDLLGTLVVGHDITLRIRLQNELEFRREAEQRIQQQNETLVWQKEELLKTLENLKNTQKQLIQSEKMASLGELTAGIAHEIQNPLNFVNNFSEVSNELIDEMKEELSRGNYREVVNIAENIQQNLAKINHHGKRADSIVKNMLQHSHTATGQKQLTNINNLCEEFFRLTYHGLRAKDKTFIATMKTDFDINLEKVNVVSEDIGRVVLNLINNAFYAVTERKKLNQPDYEPTVWVSTKKVNGKIQIRVKDNGIGIPKKILDKIFQPFFTTKPTGEGTGLGLSLAYDIVTKGHGGEFQVETKEGEETTFIVQLPTL